MNDKLHPGAERILQALNDAGFEAFLVGGCVRDLIRGTTPHDWDICTRALPEQVEQVFAGLRVIETGLKHGTVTVLADGEPFEITTYRADGPYTDGRHPDSVQFVTSLNDDLARRDFTMNAIAMDRSGTLHDPFDGTADIAARRLRCVGDPDRRFQEDGLRVMRALRFASVFGFVIEPETARAVHRDRGRLKNVAAERINVELCKLLCGQSAASILREYPDVLWEFWPELEPLFGMEQRNPWHCWDGWEHTIRAVDAAPTDVVLRLTMLLHDIGKPLTKTTDKAGIDHFYGHPAASAELAGAMLRRLNFDNDTRHRVVRLVKHHDIPIDPSEKAIRRLLNRFGPDDLYRLIEIHRADNMGQAYEKVKDRLAVLAHARQIADEVIARQQCFSLRELAVTGADVIAAGIEPGPQIGRVLRALLERVINGELPNDREVLLQAIQQGQNG